MEIHQFLTTRSTALINITFPLIIVLVTNEQFNVIGTPIILQKECNESQCINEFKGIPHFPKLKIDEKREIFHYEQTIAVRDFGADDNKLRRCEVLEVNKKSVAEGVLFQLQEMLNVDVEKVPGIDKMIDILEDCDSADEYRDVSGLELELESELESKSNVIFLLFQIIIPGTKWCGFGTISENYHDLGKFRNVDKCCRSHDLCPIKISAKAERYNLENNALYTKSHCRCDEAFHECLKKENGLAAKIVGKLFFNRVSRPMCIDGVPEIPEEKMHFEHVVRDW